MAPTATRVCAARGGLADPDALGAALAEGRFAGAGLNVFELEPPEPRHPRSTLEDVVVMNRIGWYEEEAMRDVQRKAAEEAVRLVLAGPPLHGLDPR